MTEKMRILKNIEVAAYNNKKIMEYYWRVKLLKYLNRSELSVHVNKLDHPNFRKK